MYLSTYTTLTSEHILSDNNVQLRWVKNIRGNTKRKTKTKNYTPNLTN